MTRTIFRSGFVLAILVASACALPGPAIAATDETALLQSYIGGWKGRGTTQSGGNTETVVCKLDITSAAQAKVNYNGRCSLAGANLSIAGTMAYIDARKRFEAVMSSNTPFSGVAIGTRRGQAIDFKLKNRDPESGADYTVDAGIALKSGNIEIEFSVTETASGRKIVATVPFQK